MSFKPKTGGNLGAIGKPKQPFVMPKTSTGPSIIPKKPNTETIIPGQKSNLQKGATAIGGFLGKDTIFSGIGKKFIPKDDHHYDPPNNPFVDGHDSNPALDALHQHLIEDRLRNKLVKEANKYLDDKKPKNKL